MDNSEAIGQARKPHMENASLLHNMVGRQAPLRDTVRGNPTCMTVRGIPHDIVRNQPSCIILRGQALLHDIVREHAFLHDMIRGQAFLHDIVSGQSFLHDIVSGQAFL